MVLINFCKSEGETCSTSSAFCTSYLLTKIGYKVLIINFDSQESMIEQNLFDEELPNKAHDVLTGNKNIETYIEKTNTGSLYLLPSNCSLAIAELMKGKDASEMDKFSKALARINKSFDFIVINNKAEIGGLPKNSLVKSNWITSTSMPVLTLGLRNFAIGRFENNDINKSALIDSNAIFTWFNFGDNSLIVTSECEDNHNILEDVWSNYVKQEK